MAGSFAANLPTQDDWIVRRFEDLDVRMRELGPSVAKSVREIVASQVGVDGDSATATDWALSSGTWVTVASVTLDRPQWAANAVVNAASMLYVVANTAFAVPSVRTRIDGVASMEVELPEGTGASAIPYYGSQAFTRSVPGVGETITADVRVYVLNSAHWHTGPANRVAQISATAVFTR